jgi:hypothetical protein
MHIYAYHTDTPRGVDDGVGKAISDLLGSIFQGFGADKNAQKRQEEGEASTEPQGVKQKSSVAVYQYFVFFIYNLYFYFSHFFFSIIVLSFYF